MKAAWVYIPRPGSLTAKVGAELQRIGRPITRLEIIRTFAVANDRAVQPSLLRAVQRGYLVTVKIDGLSGYDLASRQSATPEAVSAAQVVGAKLRRISTPAAPERCSRPLRPLPDATGIDPRSCWPFAAPVRLTVQVPA